MNTFNGILLAATSDGDFFKTIGGMAEKLYDKILTIAGPIAILSVAVALIVSMTSHNQKAVDASKQVIKWVIVAFIALFILSSVFAWIVGSEGLNVSSKITN